MIHFGLNKFTRQSKRRTLKINFSLWKSNGISKNKTWLSYFDICNSSTKWYSEKHILKFDWDHKAFKSIYFTWMRFCYHTERIEKLEQENSTYQDAVCQFKQVHTLLDFPVRKYIFLFHEGCILYAKHIFPTPPKLHFVGKMLLMFGHLIDLVQPSVRVAKLPRTNPAVWNVPCLFLLCPEIHLYPVVLCFSSRNIKVCSILFCQPLWFKRRTLWFAFLVLYTQNSSVIGSSSNNLNKDNIGRNLSLKISCMGFYAFKIKFSWLLFLKECDITDQFCEVKLWQRTDRTLLLHCAD